MIFATEGIQFSHICPKSAVIERRVAAFAMEIAAKPIRDRSGRRYFANQILPATSTVTCARAAEVPTIAINRASAIGRENISYSPSPFGQNQGRQT